jgi:hypothetical protein
MEAGTETERKIGVIRSWNERGFGIVLVTHKERYFCHITQFDRATPPEVGEKVRFDVKPPRKPGELPQAINVTPIEIELPSTSALAGMESNTAEELVSR